MNYYEVLEQLIHARADQIEAHLPREVPDFCPGCGAKIKFAPYVDNRRMYALHLAEETYR